MPKRKKEKKVTLSFSIDFSKTLKKKKDRDSMFDRFRSLINENLDSFRGCEMRSRKRKRQIILEDENFLLSMSFGKQPLIRMIVNDPHKNKSIVNEIMNKVVNYVNTILGEAIGGSVNCSLTILFPQKMTNLALKLLGEGKLARINELLKQTLKPITIGFTYKIGAKKVFFSSFSNDRSAQLLNTNTVYKDKLPFNLVDKEINALDNAVKVIKKLETEL